MSKGASKRKRGWIEFKGLQFAEPFATRSELIQAIHAFFEERGLNLATRKTPLQVRFSRKRNPTIVEDGAIMPIAGLHRSEWNLTGETLFVTKEIIVYVRKHASREDLLTTLGHELDHGAWVLEGRTFDDQEKYWNRPHEVRARQVGSEWGQRLSR
ncbi:MAG: hypothetical protein KBC15_03435 [Candidatus Levybacteria bacterium]|nr:hypothetical protein [Candidatus Levybacteria bacterium]